MLSYRLRKKALSTEIFSNWVFSGRIVRFKDIDYTYVKIALNTSERCLALKPRVLLRQELG